jgi:hypothetical protein
MGTNVFNALASDEIKPRSMDCSCEMVRMQERCVRVERKENTQHKPGLFTLVCVARPSESL